MALLMLGEIALRHGAAAAEAADGDPRLPVWDYAPDRVYRLHGYVGYQIDLQFEPGESFVGLGAGDLAALGFAAQDNHLFLKPRAARIDTNLTVLTNRRSYQFEYAASATQPDPSARDLIYALASCRRFLPATRTAANRW
jgi:type IV secretion system protein VirB9